MLDVGLREKQVFKLTLREIGCLEGLSATQWEEKGANNLANRRVGSVWPSVEHVPSACRPWDQSLMQFL